LRRQQQRSKTRPGCFVAELILRDDHQGRWRRAIQAFKIELGSGDANGFAGRMLIVVRVTRELRKR
jgi:hypothetical protein